MCVRERLCHFCPALLLSKSESLIRKSVLPVFSDLQPKHSVVIDASGSHRGAGLLASLFFHPAVLFGYLSLSSLPPSVVPFSCLSYLPFYFCPSPINVSSLFFLNLLSSYPILPSFSSPPFIIFSCSLIMFYLWAKATFRLNTKHRGKH